MVSSEEERISSEVRKKMSQKSDCFILQKSLKYDGAILFVSESGADSGSRADSESKAESESEADSESEEMSITNLVFLFGFESFSKRGLRFFVSVDFGILVPYVS